MHARGACRQAWGAYDCHDCIAHYCVNTDCAWDMTCDCSSCSSEDDDDVDAIYNFAS